MKNHGAIEITRYPTNELWVQLRLAFDLTTWGIEVCVRREHIDLHLLCFAVELEWGEPFWMEKQQCR